MEGVKILSVLAIVIGLLLIIWEVPQLQIAEAIRLGLADPSQIPELTDAYRRTLAQIVGGTAVLFGLYLTWRRVLTSERTQVVDAFGRAVEQVGSERSATRLGGIYALGRISEEQPTELGRVFNILHRFLQESTIGLPLSEDDDGFKLHELNTGSDIKAAISIISQPHFRQLGDQGHVVLERRFLGGLDLRNAQLDNAILSGSYLTGSDFSGASMKQAVLIECDLTDCRFVETNLAGADLGCWIDPYNGRCPGEGSTIEHANFDGADLSDARLQGVTSGDDQTFRAASFKKAILDRCNLHHARILKADFEDCSLKGASLVQGNVSMSSFKGADLAGANFEQTYVGHASFRGAHSLTREQVQQMFDTDTANGIEDHL